jgi:hypothetical protein
LNECTVAVLSDTTATVDFANAYYIDPTQDGAEVVLGVMDRVRAEMVHRVGLADLLTPSNIG